MTLLGENPAICLSSAKRIAGLATTVLVAAGLSAGCGSGSGGATVGDSDASCSVSGVTSFSIEPTDYQVTLDAATNEVPYFADKASVTVSGGLDGPTTTSQALDTPIPMPGEPGMYIIQASVPLAADAPKNYRGVVCRLTLTVGS